MQFESIWNNGFLSKGHAFKKISSCEIQFFFKNNFNQNRELFELAAFYWQD
jgi:hypothetical protein